MIRFLNLLSFEHPWNLDLFKNEAGNLIALSNDLRVFYYSIAPTLLYFLPFNEIKLLHHELKILSCIVLSVHPVYEMYIYICTRMGRHRDDFDPLGNDRARLHFSPPPCIRHEHLFVTFIRICIMLVHGYHGS